MDAKKRTGRIVFCDVSMMGMFELNECYFYSVSGNL